MFRTYDDWKLATPPEYDEPPTKEGEDEPTIEEAPVTLRVPYSRPGMGMRDKRSE